MHSASATGCVSSSSSPTRSTSCTCTCRELFFCPSQPSSWVSSKLVDREASSRARQDTLISSTGATGRFVLQRQVFRRYLQKFNEDQDSHKYPTASNHPQTTDKPYLTENWQFYLSKQYTIMKNTTWCFGSTSSLAHYQLCVLYMYWSYASANSRED